MSRRRQGAATELRQDSQLLRTLFTLVPWPMRRRVVMLVVATALVAALDIFAVGAMLPLTQMLTTQDVPPLVQRYLVPMVRTSDRQELLLVLATGVGLAFIIKNLLTIVLRWWSIGVTQKASAAAQSEMLRRYVASPYLAHRMRSKATILQVVTSAVPTSFGSVLLGYITILVDGLTMVMLFLTLLLIAPLASVAALAVFGGAALLVARVLKPWALRVALRSLELNTAAWGYVNPAIEGFRESRIFGKQQLFTEAYDENRQNAASLNRDSVILGELPKYIFEVVMILGIILIAVVLFLTHDESTAFGMLAMFAAATIRIVPALNRLVATLNGVRAGRSSLELVCKEVHELSVDMGLARSTGEVIVQIPPDDIVVKDLSFRFPDGGSDVLSGVDVRIEAGSTVALVGSSGAGKTTFADILSGLFEPTTGSITVHGVDITEHPRSWLANVAVVSQKVYVWDASLRDLITFGESPETVDETHLHETVRRAGLAQVVASLPHGLETRIGEGGARLSGGQVQRVGIARALYARPSVLILDEATSALDNQTEHEITETIKSLHGQITVIVIAHRLSTVQHADEILFFSHGRLKGRGTMAELRHQEPEFARLVELGSLRLDNPRPSS
ncbi:ABC transporter ATP-binding protein/permease [Aestuariimicrobium sp. p3-SID1156]|uniref:ABC transporter ATP-binding protein n=1 Tax=Aestuariimicrobium sp. p3-SID1156 TaxID=2916038 RepID=UPI00223AF25C|nr:ABC transporter ATP-binding protein [Aestuariimicrobium sp. p3-SID1156]MCT1458259.1 ABC transporter ATP-binding protein/permease [Aestuariimicrobium sp. p3-SID1156]